MGYVGFKIIPDHWYAYEPRLEPWWDTLNELEARVLFHTGILWGYEDGSRFNRPVYLEKLLWYPKIRFAMAHVSWPWCEECLAVMGRMRAGAGQSKGSWQSYIDLTPGRIRKDVIADAIEMCGAERIMFGSDACIPRASWEQESLSRQKRALEKFASLFNEMGLTQAQQERIFSGTADELFPATV